MTEVYRIATKVPWEDDIRDWSHKYSHLDAVVDEMMDRMNNPHHRGQQFKERWRGNEPFGKDLMFKDVRPAVERDLKRATPGDAVWVKSNKDDIQWRIRVIEGELPSINRPEANTHIDFIYTWVMRNHRNSFPGVENWGTCNRRFIDGTTIWSQHAPWLPGDPGCNAIDFHSSYEVMHNLSRVLTSNPEVVHHVAKSLFYGQEWLPGGGWRPVPGVGHYDHLHIEGPRDHGALDSACRY